MMIFRTLKFQFSLILYWDRQCAHLCVAACLSGITHVSHFHTLLSGQIHPEAGLWTLPKGIWQHLPFLFPSSFIYIQDTV